MATRIYILHVEYMYAKVQAATASFPISITRGELETSDVMFITLNAQHEHSRFGANKAQICGPKESLTDYHYKLKMSIKYIDDFTFCQCSIAMNIEHAMLYVSRE